MKTRNQEKTKKCEICGQELPNSEFSKSYRNRCKACVAEQVREQRKNGKMATSFVDWEQREFDTAKELFISQMNNSRLPNASMDIDVIQRSYAAKAIKAARNFIEVCKEGGEK